MNKQLGSTSVEDFDFETGINLSAKDSGFTFQIGEVGLLDTKYGVVAVITNKDNGEQMFTYGEVVVNAIRTSINKGIKLLNRIVTVVHNDSSNFDEETGEVYTYLTLEEATSEAKFARSTDRKIANDLRRKEFLAGKAKEANKVDPPKKGK